MNKLKSFRLSTGLSQEKIARKMNVTVSYYSQIEREHVPVSRDFMQRLKKIYPDINIDEMFFNEDIMSRVVL